MTLKQNRYLRLATSGTSKGTEVKEDDARQPLIRTPFFYGRRRRRPPRYWRQAVTHAYKAKDLSELMAFPFRPLPKQNTTMVSPVLLLREDIDPGFTSAHGRRRQMAQGVQDTDRPCSNIPTQSELRRRPALANGAAAPTDWTRSARTVSYGQAGPDTPPSLPTVLRQGGGQKAHARRQRPGNRPLQKPRVSNGT